MAWYAYEYLLTLPLEVEVLWKSKPSLTIILFLINRYTFMLEWALTCVLDSIITDINVCTTMTSFEVVANVLNNISVSGIFILRTYAIYGRNKWILVSLGLLFLSRLGLAIRYGADEAKQSGILLIPGVDGIGNCVSAPSSTLVVIEIILTVVFDAMVFILTISRTWSLSRQAKAAGIEASLTELLLRDGSLYFGTLSVVAILEAVSLLDANLPVFLSSLANFGFPLEVILANRLILNLRTHSQLNDSMNPTTKTDIFFHRAYGGSRVEDRSQSAIYSVLGNIGAPLRVDDEPEDGGEDEPQLPIGEREHRSNTEDGVDPLNLERIQSPGERAVNEGEISEFRV